MVGIGFDLAPMLDELRSLCRRSAGFDIVHPHEPRKPPAAGHSVGAWLNAMDPIPRRSGLAATSLRIEFTVRIYLPMSGRPDQIDTETARRVDLIFAALHEDITITPLDHEIDWLGAYGETVRARSGWLSMDNSLIRIMDIFIPVIVNDAYAQERS
jgi:hypothetical protein